MAKPSNQIRIADKSRAIDWPTFNFHDDADPGWNAASTTCVPTVPGGSVACGEGGMPRARASGISSPKRMRPRSIGLRKEDRTLAAAAAYIRQMVIHLDGCADAAMCWDVLHNERGLSCHFILDNDGTLYQTLDLIDCAYHAAGINETSIGIEICNRGNYNDNDAKRYAASPWKRGVRTCHIHDETYVSFDFTEPQYKAMEALGRFLSKYLPGIKLDFPKNGGTRDQLWTVLDPTDPTGASLQKRYVGYLGHYHITRQKWDPGPFDFRKFVGKFAGRSFFPVALPDRDRVEVPDDKAELARAADAYYHNNEELSGGGYFPVGPLDMHQLYHGGVHLLVAEGAAVHAPWKGTLVAARNVKPDKAVGSVSFVLLRHSVHVKGEELDFYSLLFHLREEAVGDKQGRLKWMANPQWQAGTLTIFADHPQPVQAGEVVGHVGVAGPHGLPHLHFEVFLLDDAYAKADKLDRDDPRFWTRIVEQGARFCHDPRILARLDRRPRDGVVTEAELDDLYAAASDDRSFMRKLVTFHPSEWSEAPDWKDEIRRQYPKAKPTELKRLLALVDTQVAPTLWWTEQNYELLKLPRGSGVYTFHPITFLRWLDEMLLADAAVGVTGVPAATAAQMAAAATLKGRALTDLEDTGGVSFVTARETELPERPVRPELDRIIEGYGDP